MIIIIVSKRTTKNQYVITVHEFGFGICLYYNTYFKFLSFVHFQNSTRYILYYFEQYAYPQKM